MRARIAAAALGVLASSAPAHAGDEGQGAIIGTDLTANTLMVAGLIGEYGTVGIVGVSAYVIGGPIVHARYGRWARAGQSLGIRIAAPPVLGFIGCEVFGDRNGEVSDDGTKEPDWPCVLGGFGGIVLGMIGAELVDWTVLAGGGDAEPAARMFTIGGRF